MLENRRLRWRTSLTYAGAILLLALTLIVLANLLIRDAFTRALEAYARTDAEAAAADPEVAAAWRAGDVAALGELLARHIGDEATVAVAISPEGDVLAASSAEETTPDGSGALSGAQEVRRALAQGYGRAVRAAGPQAERMLFVAVPVASDGETLGVLRWAAPIAQANTAALPLQRSISAILLAGSLLLAGLLLWERERGAVALRRLTEMVERALVQQFDAHVLTFGMGEVSQLTQATNRLVDKYRKATKRRAREKDRLNTLLTHMSSGALILTEFGRVRLINPAGAAILHTTPERALRQSFVQVAWDHRIAEVFQRCQKSGIEESETIELAGDRFIRVTVTPFLGGSASGFLVILNDLTPVRRLEKVRRDFVSNVSHELRTPLASLTALVDTLRDGAIDDPPAAKRFLDRMEVEVDKLTQMVQELLELSRIESGQLPLRLSTCSVRQFVQPAVERLAMQAERAGVSLALELPENLPGVVVDMERMQQVVINLIHNAIKFTPGGGHVQVGASVDPERPRMVTVRVQDTGVGIPAGEQARIFERFYKADRSRSGGGTGLGLAIAKHTVLAHGGSIWVESREGQGSTFFFTLPADDGPPMVAPERTATPTPRQPPLTHR